jgi:hypothetical protein
MRWWGLAALPLYNHVPGATHHHPVTGKGDCRYREQEKSGKKDDTHLSSPLPLDQRV